MRRDRDGNDVAMGEVLGLELLLLKQHSRHTAMVHSRSAENKQTAWVRGQRVNNKGERKKTNARGGSQKRKKKKITS